MQHTLIVLSTNRGLHERCRRAVEAARAAGASYLHHSGVSDVTMARNQALSHACETLQNAPNIDTVFMLDDDIEFTVEQMRTVVERSRATGGPVSAVYPTIEGNIAATRLRSKSQPDRLLWATGLGFLAIPRAALLQLKAKSEHFDFYGRSTCAFTSASLDHGVWWPEDFTLCRRLGGVELLPISVGHLKTIALTASAEALEAIRTGAPMPKTSVDWPAGARGTGNV